MEFKLRHYGADAYDPAKFLPVKDWGWIKPRGGLWTSPIDSEWGWKQWSDSESFGDTTKLFDINFSGNVLTIDSLSDIDKLVWSKSYLLEDNSYRSEFPHYENLIEIGIDAIHLTVKGQEETRFSFPKNLYGWDCETVFVMNPKCLY